MAIRFSDLSDITLSSGRRKAGLSSTETFPFRVYIIKSVVIRATETECLGHGMVRSTGN